jgi:hypothetical protein
VKELDDVYHMPGMLTPAEVDCLFQLGQFNQRPGVIVEIGSWKGKSKAASSHSTILLENRVPSGFCGNTSFAPVDFRKSPSSTTLLRLERLIARPCRRDYGNTWTLALRAIYIASRKSRVPHSRTIGRKLLRRCTRQTWLPVILFVFSANIAR